MNPWTISCQEMRWKRSLVSRERRSALSAKNVARLLFLSLLQIKDEKKGRKTLFWEVLLVFLPFFTQLSCYICFYPIGSIRFHWNLNLTRSFTTTSIPNFLSPFRFCLLAFFHRSISSSLSYSHQYCINKNHLVWETFRAGCFPIATTSC